MENVNVMELIDKLRGDTIDDIQLTLITMINQNRKQTSVLGFTTSRVPNPSVVRNIVE